MESGVDSPRSSSNPRKRHRIDGPEEEFRSSPPNEEEGPLITPNLPEELIFEILSRLPSRSLGRFKCVARSWFSLISSSNFIKTHLAIASGSDNYTNHSILFELYPGNGRSYLKKCSISSVQYPATAPAFTSSRISNVSTELSDIDYPMKDPSKSFWVVGSCNGLVCVRVCVGKEERLFLWNPCTKKSKELHDIDMVKKNDPCDDMFGFGYDELNDDYKVVKMLCKLTAPRPGGGRFSYVTKVSVYSLKNDSWSQIGCCKKLATFTGEGCFASGNLHWIVISRGSNTWKFLSLDLASETYGEIKWPSSKEVLDGFGVGVLGGCLSVLYDYEKINADVWVMKQYGVTESWTKIISVPRIEFPRKFDSCMPVCLLRNGDILLIIQSVLVLYSPKSSTFRCYPRINNVLGVSIFVESLVSPDFHDGEQNHIQLNG